MGDDFQVKKHYHENKSLFLFALFQPLPDCAPGCPNNWIKDGTKNQGSILLYNFLIFFLKF